MLPLGQGTVEQILPVEFVQEMPPPPPKEINTCRCVIELIIIIRLRNCTEEQVEITLHKARHTKIGIMCFRWTKEECDIIYWYFVQSSQSSDPVGHILNQYTENGSSCKTRVGVSQLLKKEIYT
jgi:hypothetical protein